MLPDSIKKVVSRPISWDEMDCGEEDLQNMADPETFEAWELGFLLNMVFPQVDIDTIVSAIKQRIADQFPSIKISEFNEHWRLVYEKYGFLHVQMPITIEGTAYFIELFSCDPHGKRTCDDATLSNTPHILGNKHFYM